MFSKGLDYIINHNYNLVKYYKFYYRLKQYIE